VPRSYGDPRGGGSRRRRKKPPAFAALCGRYAQAMDAGDVGAEIDVEPARVESWMAEDPPAQVIDVREPYEREAGSSCTSRRMRRASTASDP